MRSRRLFLGLVTWLLVVAVSSTVAWAVISRAGDNLVSTDEPVVATQTETRRSAPTQTVAPAEPSASPTVATSQPATRAPTPTASSSAPPSAPPPSASATPRSSPSSPASPTRSTEPARVPQRRTWQGTGGRLVVACDGSDISLVSALPDPGFKYEVGDEGAGGLEVEFQGGDDQDGAGSHVKATCVAGVPDFDVETHGAENDEHDQHE